MTQPKILVVEDDTVLNEVLVETLQNGGYDAKGVTCLAEARECLNSYEPTLILLDGQLPDGHGMELFNSAFQLPPVIMLTAYASIREAVNAIKVGAIEYLVKPIDLDKLEQTIERVLNARSWYDNERFSQSFIESPQPQEKREKRMVGKSKAIKKVYDLIQKVGPTEMSVLIYGESGVGKELVAAEIHRLSQRSQKEHVALDCCSLQEKLFESELFGHEKGSFTGADRQKKGLIEIADGGTLFLDEIGEIEAPIQAKLLRVLETKKFRRVGGTKDLSSDARIVAATNCNLEDMSQEGSFRLDLFYRLSGFVITIPPLRERAEDIPDLVEHFLNKCNCSRQTPKKFSPGAMKELMAYDWPGNIRELKNVVERAVVLADNRSTMTVEHLTFSIASTKKKKQMGVNLTFDHQPTLQEIEKHYLKVLLDKYSGHRLRVAEALGVSERNTYRLIKKYGLGYR
jgi:DNA-binding NtrC family response regulator